MFGSHDSHTKKVGLQLIFSSVFEIYQTSIDILTRLMVDFWPGLCCRASLDDSEVQIVTIKWTLLYLKIGDRKIMPQTCYENICSFIGQFEVAMTYTRFLSQNLCKKVLKQVVGIAMFTCHAKYFAMLALCSSTCVTEAASQIPGLASLDTLPNDHVRLQHLTQLVESFVYRDADQTTVLAAIADSIAKENGAPELLARSQNLKGMSLFATKQYEASISAYLRSLHILDQYDHPALRALVYNNLAGSYQYAGDFDGCVRYFLKALEYYQTTRNGLWIANINNNLAIQYMNQGKLEEADQYFETSMYHYDTLQLDLYMGITSLNYANLKNEKTEYEQAIPLYHKAMQLVSRETNVLLHAASLGGLGVASNALHAYDDAISHLTKSIELSREIGHTEQEKVSLEALASSYEKKGLHAQSLKTYKLFSAVKDSLFLQQQNQQLVDALQKYQAVEKEKEISDLNAKNEIAELRLSKSKQAFGFSLLAAIFFLGFLAYLFTLYRKIKHQNGLIQQALAEKNALIQEIHHRVKNNLQVVSSLLNLQTRFVNDPNAKQALHKGQSRVQSMALIHQNLYQQEGLTGINVSTYLEKLTKTLFHTYNLEERISLEMDIDDFTIDVDTMIPLGLIINELITNALKHAFEEQQTGKIKVTLKEHGDGLIFQIADNGIGLDHKLLPELRKSSLGFKLIDTFSEQLNAELKIRRKEGTIITLHINQL